jgi:hypothetical protein
MKEPKMKDFSPEDTAFIHQQIEELSEYLSPQGFISVKKIQTNSKGSPHAIMITITEGKDVLLKMKVKDTSVSGAIMKGKNQIRKFLDEAIDESMSTAARQAEINKVLSGNSTKH